MAVLAMAPASHPEEGITPAEQEQEMQIVPAATDAQGMIDFIAHTMNGVLAGTYTPRQANAVVNLGGMALKAVELQWKMNRSKEISYIVKQLERNPVEGERNAQEDSRQER